MPDMRSIIYSGLLIFVIFKGKSMYMFLLLQESNICCGKFYTHIYYTLFFHNFLGNRCGSNRMVVGFIATSASSVYRH